MRRPRRQDDLGGRVQVGHDVKLPDGSDILTATTIGDGTRFAGAVFIRGAAPCQIGKYCAIGRELDIITSDHPTDGANLQLALQRRVGAASRVRASPVEIGHNCWIGDRVIVLAGSTIGDGSVIAAGSVVRGDIPPFSIAAGVPARVIRQRFSDEVVQLLQQLAWWHWEPERLSRNQRFFDACLDGLTPAQIEALVVP